MPDSGHILKVEPIVFAGVPEKEELGTTLSSWMSSAAIYYSGEDPRGTEYLGVESRLWFWIGKLDGDTE